MAIAAAKQVKAKAKGAAVQQPQRGGMTAPVIPISAVKNLGFSVSPKATVSPAGGLTLHIPQVPLPPWVEAELQIDAKYSQFGGAAGFLGQQISDIQASPDGVGFFKQYQVGSIYYSPSSGACEVHGAIRDEWRLLGSEQSFLGYPVTDETGAPDGVGRFNHFQEGSIYWTPGSGAHEIHGASGASIGFQHSGHTEGTVAGLPFGTPNREDDFVTPQGLNNQQVVANWDQLTQASLFWRLDATDTLTQGAAQFLGDLAQQALKALGSAAVAGLVALIFV
jgi:hypothetical protein